MKRKLLAAVLVSSALLSAPAFAIGEGEELDASIGDVETYLVDLGLLSGDRADTEAFAVGAKSGFKYADQGAEIYEYDITSGTYQSIAENGSLTIMGFTFDFIINHQFALLGSDLSEELVNAFLAFDGADPADQLVMPDSIEELWEMYLSLLNDYNQLKGELEALKGVPTESVYTATGDKYELTITDAYVFDSYNFFGSTKKAADGNVFVGLDLDARNITDEDDYFNYFYFDCYADGYSKSISMDIEGHLSLMAGDVKAGRHLTGSIAFELPTDWKDLEVYYKEDYFGDSIKLEISSDSELFAD